MSCNTGQIGSKTEKQSSDAINFRHMRMLYSVRSASIQLEIQTVAKYSRFRNLNKTTALLELHYMYQFEERNKRGTITSQYQSR